MAVDAYLQIEGIKGESADAGHKDWIEVSHVTWSVHQPRSSTANPGFPARAAGMSACSASSGVGR